MRSPQRLAACPTGRSTRSSILASLAPSPSALSAAPAPPHDPANWQASPMPARAPKPGGTPGKVNAAYATALPPIIRSVTGSPEDPTPNRAIRVEAVLAPGQAVKSVTILYHVLRGGVP